MQNDWLQLKAQQIYQIGIRGEGKGEIQTFKDLVPIQLQINKILESL